VQYAPASEDDLNASHNWVMPSKSEERQLIAILRRGYESKELDYKGPMSWDESSKESCCGLVKDILGMANTVGGFIVIGVSEPNGFSWDGLSPEQLGTFETSGVNRFLQNYAEPPVNALLRNISDSNKNFVIIEVPQFPDTPHICVKEYPKVLTAPTLYIRTDNNETAPIRSSSDFRLVLAPADDGSKRQAPDLTQGLPGVRVVPHQCDDAEQHRRRAKDDPPVQCCFHTGNYPSPMIKSNTWITAPPGPSALTCLATIRIGRPGPATRCHINLRNRLPIFSRLRLSTPIYPYSPCHYWIAGPVWHNPVLPASLHDQPTPNRCRIAQECLAQI
jgi:hypothetical protein